MNEPVQLQAPSAPGLSPEALALLRHVEVLATLDDEGLRCLSSSTELHLDRGTLLVKQGDFTREFYILLAGTLAFSYSDPEGREMNLYTMNSGASFGEVPLLAGIAAPFSIHAAEPAHLLQLNEDQFWALMTQCTGVRKAILGNMALRLAKTQNATFQQEKMVALGTLAAGLMHELNNPGSAARRASQQLRENLTRMHALTAKWSKTDLSHEQKQCMFDLQDYALAARPTPTLDSLQQADSEQALADWLEEAEVEDAWRIAPTFTAAGIEADHLACARGSFVGPLFSDAINWLEALVSSMQLVGTIEESIGRVTDLVKAVKSYAYEGRGRQQELDVNQSIHATLVILGHKLREKQITLDKSLAPNLPLLHTQCTGLNQIWTNLLDNAIDAAPQGGRIGLRTWAEPAAGAAIDSGASAPSKLDLCILVSDNGSGVPLESQPHIFDSFYTTKPAGIGTGLGLGIVHRIVEQIGGSIRFSSIPGETEFVVRLPTDPA